LPSLMASPSYSELKQLYIEKRRTFKENPGSAADLEAYSICDNAHNYTVLKGFIPQALVGKKTPGGQGHRGKSDTFFSDFLKNHPDQVLSESEESLVIGNIASHDTRQYLATWDTDGKDRTAAAGMSYMHLLVIPKRRVYNAVALDDTVIIDEMMAHFRRFWITPNSVDKVIGWLNTAVERRASAVRDSLKSHAADRIDKFDIVMKDILASSEEFASKLRLLQNPEDDNLLFFGFHPAPEASIAHLHMHVILMGAEFRKFSTHVHDWKTIPVQAVIEVIDEEARTSTYQSTQILVV